MNCRTILNTTLKCCIQIACIIFVVCQAYQCVKKYADWPQRTHASLQKALNYPYPDITICPIQGSDADIYGQIKEVDIYGFNEFHSNKTYTNNTEFWLEKDTFYNGRCLIFKIPKNSEILHFWFDLGKVEVFFTSPGDFLVNHDKISMVISNNRSNKVNVHYEVFDILNTEEQPCQAGNIRDECINDFVTAKKAPEIVDSKILEKACPESCIQVRTSFGSQSVEDTGQDGSDVPNQLVLHFQNTIKVSKSYWAYTGLSLLAEVGGYVGLFLGVSLNQITHIFEKILMYRRNQKVEIQ